jgi:hypothetical protein
MRTFRHKSSFVEQTFIVDETCQPGYFKVRTASGERRGKFSAKTSEYPTRLEYLLGEGVWVETTDISVAEGL